MSEGWFAWHTARFARMSRQYRTHSKSDLDLGSSARCASPTTGSKIPVAIIFGWFWRLDARLQSAIAAMRWHRSSSLRSMIMR